MDYISFEQLNLDWNAEPNAPEVEIYVDDNKVTAEFFLNAFKYKQFSEEDKAKLTFYN